MTDEQAIKAAEEIYNENVLPTDVLTVPIILSLMALCCREGYIMGLESALARMSPVTEH